MRVKVLRYTIQLHSIISFSCICTAIEASDYAHARAVILKGDILIGVARNRADAWQHCELFNLAMQVGAELFDRQELQVRDSQDKICCHESNACEEIARDSQLEVLHG